MSYTDLVKGNVAQFLPYVMHQPLDVVQKEMKLKDIYRFHALESPYGVSPKVSKVLNNYAKEASTRYSYPNINLYPDASSYKLKKKLSEIFKYDLRNLVIGAGAHELSSLVLHTFLQPGMTAVMPRLSSFEIENYLSLMGVNLVLTPVSEDWSPNFDILADAVNEHDARLVYIANPSIPIGGFAIKARFKNFLNKINPENTIVVVNEEFIDFLGDGYSDMYTMIANYPNLVLLRSFSHAYGLTDMRVGYLLATEEIASILNVVHMPYQVSQLAQECACAALEDSSFLRDVVYAVAVERNRIQEFCAFFSLRMINTVTNSVTIPFGSRMDRIYHDLQKSGIFIRSLSHFGLNELCNITIGRSMHTERLLTVLEKSLMLNLSEDKSTSVENFIPADKSSDPAEFSTKSTKGLVNETVSEMLNNAELKQSQQSSLKDKLAKVTPNLTSKETNDSLESSNAANKKAKRTKTKSKSAKDADTPPSLSEDATFNKLYKKFQDSNAEHGENIEQSFVEQAKTNELTAPQEAEEPQEVAVLSSLAKQGKVATTSKAPAKAKTKSKDKAKTKNQTKDEGKVRNTRLDAPVDTSLVEINMHQASTFSEG